MLAADPARWYRTAPAVSRSINPVGRSGSSPPIGRRPPPPRAPPRSVRRKGPRRPSPTTRPGRPAGRSPRRRCSRHRRGWRGTRSPDPGNRRRRSAKASSRRARSGRTARSRREARAAAATAAAARPIASTSAALVGAAAAGAPQADARGAGLEVTVTSSTPMPPVGTSGTSGSGPRSARTWPGPPVEAGNSFTATAPSARARSTSLGVNAPGTTSTPSSRARSITGSTTPGDTTKDAPASTQASTCAGDTTVPADRASGVAPAPQRLQRARGVERDLHERDTGGDHRFDRGIDLSSALVPDDREQPRRGVPAGQLRLLPLDPSYSLDERRSASVASAQ